MMSEKGSGNDESGVPGDSLDDDEVIEEPPPVLKSWKNIYIVVLLNLLFWISLFTYFTWAFK